jgi:hypothetical protein
MGDKQHKNVKLRRKVSHYQILQNDRLALANFHHFSPNNDVNKIFQSFFIFCKLKKKSQHDTTMSETL